MYPHNGSLVKRLRDKPFALIGVNSDKDRERIKAVIKEKRLRWRSFWNGPKGTEGPISTAWAVYVWPTVYVLDAKGRIRFKHLDGGMTDRAVDRLLAKMEQRADGKRR